MFNDTDEQINLKNKNNSARYSVLAFSEVTTCPLVRPKALINQHQ